MTRVAAVDCGTNTIKLLVADIDVAAGTQDTLVREMRIVRLGQDVDRTGRLADEALARVFAAVEEYAAVDRGPRRRRRSGSSPPPPSATRATPTYFARGVRDRLGVEPEVVSGDEEAALSYDGATRALDDVPGAGGGARHRRRLDRADPRRRARPRHAAAQSLDIGSVRLTERLMPSDPPTAARGRGRDPGRRRGARHPPVVRRAASATPHARRHRGDGHHRRGDPARPRPLRPRAGARCVVLRWPRCTTSAARLLAMTVAERERSRRAAGPLGRDRRRGADPRPGAAALAAPTG